MDSRPETNGANKLQLSCCCRNGGQSSCEFFIEHAPKCKPGSQPKKPRAKDSEKALISKDYLSAGTETDVKTSIAVYISCAFNNGESYLGCDDRGHVILTDSPQIWLLRRGRDAMGMDDVMDVSTTMVRKAVKAVAVAAVAAEVG